MWFALLTGCLTPWGMGGEETDGIGPALDEGVTGTSTPPSIDAVDAAVVDSAALTFTATGGDGMVSVEHVLRGSCATSWSGADVTEESSTLVVSYDASTPDTASPACTWQLRYDIVSVPPGEWTVSAAGQTATVTVAR